METVSIEITIAGLRYPLKVARTDEPLIRQAEKQINEQLSKLQGTPGARNMQDYMALLLVSSWLENLKKQKRQDDTEKELQQKLGQSLKILENISATPSVGE